MFDRLTRRFVAPAVSLAVACLVLHGCRSDAPPRPEGVARSAPAPVVVDIAPKPATPTLLERLVTAAPDADPEVLALALQSRQCAIRHGEAGAQSRLAVIDYSLPSTDPRLWVFDMQQFRLLYREHVAHGRNSGGNLATHFSNEEGSFASSLGLFRTAETYQGGNGYSLRMDGLEPGINDRARDRAVVMHGAWYVDPEMARKQGRLGRSYGCPALRPQIADAVIDTLKQGQLLFAYYPDQKWLAHSRLLSCASGKGQS